MSAGRSARRPWRFPDRPLSSVYANSVGLRAMTGALVPLLSFQDAYAHVENTFRRGRRLALRRVVRNLAQAKGAPTRVTEAAALRFFRR